MRRGTSGAGCLCEDNMGLVHLAAWRAKRRGIDYDEAVQDGTVGLLDAVERWDEGKGVAFSTFAYPRIHGAILDGMRRRDPMPRLWCRRSVGIARAKERLRAGLQSEPSKADVAAEMDVPVEDVWRWDKRLQAATPVSLDKPIAADVTRLPQELIAGEDGRDYSDRLQKMFVVNAQMKQLKPQEVQILGLYFYDGLKLREIGEIYGVSEARICQIRTGAISKLRRLCA